MALFQDPNAYRRRYFPGTIPSPRYQKTGATITMELNDRREGFCAAIVAGSTIAAAYVKAGYSTAGRFWERNASRLREQPDIQQRIAELRATRAEVEARATQRAVARLAITKEAVARELLPLAESNIADYLARDPVTGKITLEFDLNRATLQQLKAIKSIQVERVVRGSGAESREVEKVRFILHDKVAAHVTLARLFGWLLDPVREAPPGPYEARLRQMTVEQRAAEGEKLLEKARQRIEEFRATQDGAATDLEPDGEGGFRVEE